MKIGTQIQYLYSIYYSSLDFLLYFVKREAKFRGILMKCIRMKILKRLFFILYKNRNKNLSIQTRKNFQFQKFFSYLNETHINENFETLILDSF